MSLGIIKDAMSLAANLVTAWPLIKRILGSVITVVTVVIPFISKIEEIKRIWIVISLMLLWQLGFSLHRIIVGYKNEQEDKLPNPVFFKSVETVVEINDVKGCTRIDTIIIKALKNEVHTYRFNITKTAAKNIIISVLNNCGTLFKNEDCAAEAEYQYWVVFEPLKKGEEKTIFLRWEVESLANAAYVWKKIVNKFEYLKIEISFPKNMIRDVIACTKNIKTSVMIKGVEEIAIKDHRNGTNKSQCSWIVQKGATFSPIENRTYALSWKWND